MRTAAIWAWAAIMMAAPFVSLEVDAQPFTPPAGYSGQPGPGVAVPTDPEAPTLTRVPDASLSGLFQVDPAYARAALAHVKVIGAFTVAETTDLHLVAAWAPGFLPITLSFSDGRCFSLAADYVGGILSNGRMKRASCDRSQAVGVPPPAPPADRALRSIGYAWGYGAWADERIDTTIVSAPETTVFEPLFTADMETVAIMAMNGPDWPGGNVTLVGRIKGQLTVVTLEVGF